MTDENVVAIVAAILMAGDARIAYENDAALNPANYVNKAVALVREAGKPSAWVAEPEPVTNEAKP